jgi:hypothetical protein
LRENRFRGSPVACWELKRYVVGRFGLGRVGAIAEHAELPRHDFSPVTFAASVLRFVLEGSEPTLDVNLTAFAQEPFVDPVGVEIAFGLFAVAGRNEEATCTRLSSIERCEEWKRRSGY